MALADYFSKDLLAISQALRKGSREQFEDVLNSTIVGIAFDDDIEKAEGSAILDLTIRLLTRLYPRLKFMDHRTHQSTLNIAELSKSINSKIELVDNTPSVVIAIGATAVPTKDSKGPVFYVGSDHWNAKFSSKRPVGTGDSSIPLGAGAAACIGASNVFRYIFRDFIGDVEFDSEFSLSLVDFQFEKDTNNAAAAENIDLGSFTLVGFGAIGSGAIWALSRMPSIKAEITIVEPEDVEVTNLQRYVLAEERHIGKPKMKIAEEYLTRSELELNPIKDNWAGYLKIHNAWREKRVLIAIDNVKDRIAIQSSLPKEITNSYTENNLIGIARHKNFGESACVVCTYMPSEQKRSYSQEVSDNLGLPHLEIQIRNYLHYGLPADEKLIRWVAEANSVDYSQLERFKGIPVSDFYAKVVCGGTLMELKKEGVTTENVEAPLAFQSAMTGILLMAETIVSKAALRKDELPTVTHFYPLFPIKEGINPHSHSFPKDVTGRCICSDGDFLAAYKNKWTMSVE